MIIISSNSDLWQNQASIKKFTWPVLSSLPLYTRPNPPSPKKDSGLKFFVAAASSRKVNVWAAILTPGPSLGHGNSFLNPTLLLDLSLSAPTNSMITKKCRFISITQFPPRHSETKLYLRPKLSTDCKDNKIPSRRQNEGN